MKTYTSEDGFRETFYDHHIRLWTMIDLDDDGYQIGCADYTVDRKEAMKWLKG